MVRQSNYRSGLLETVMRLIPEAQDATDTLDEAAAGQLHVNRTDLRCLGVIFRSGTISASGLAAEVGLTRGAMTTALDRLETAGYIRRSDDPRDGRGVRVESTPAANVAVQRIWGPIGTEGAKHLAQYSDDDLEVIRRFLEEYCKLQRVHAERIRGMVKEVDNDRTRRRGHGPQGRRRPE